MHTHTLNTHCVDRSGVAKVVDLNKEQAQVVWARFPGKVWVDFYQIVSVSVA
jgi:hypothetical protein